MTLTVVRQGEKTGSREALASLVAAVVYAALGLGYLWPFPRVFADHLAPDAADPLLGVYILKWVGHQAHLGFPDLWRANVFFPARDALAFSDHFLLPGLLTAQSSNTVAAYNVLILASFVLVGLAVRFVLRRSGVSPFAALLGGAMFTFSPYRLSQLNHLALLFAWFPLVLWSFDRLLAERTARRGALFLLFYGLSLTSGCYLAYMVHLPLLAIAASRGLAHGRELLRPAALRVLVPVAVLSTAGALAMFLPYIRLSHATGMARHEGEVVSYAAALPSYLSPSTENRYSLRSTSDLERQNAPRWAQPFLRSENSLFPGFLASGLALYGGFLLVRKYRLPRTPATGWRRDVLAGLTAVAVVAFVLGDVYTLKLDIGTALSPWLPWVSRGLWIGLGLTFLASLALRLVLGRRWEGTRLDWGAMDPWERGLLFAGGLSFLLSFSVVYVALMQVVPGMNGMRVPARFSSFVMVTVVFLAARGLDDLIRRIGPIGRIGRIGSIPIRAALLACLALGLALELWPRPVRWVPVPRPAELPAVYAWLAGRPEIGAILEVPMKPDSSEAFYMYASTVHWKPIANGFSGFIPASYDRLAETVQRFLPDDQALTLAQEMGITHLVVHADRLGGQWRRLPDPTGFVDGWERETGGRLEKVYVGGDGVDRVYRIVAAKGSPG